jgi:hypothetical protein
MLVAYRAGPRAVFLYGFAKRERKNIEGREAADAAGNRGGVASGRAEQVARAIEGRLLQEVIDGGKDAT